MIIKIKIRWKFFSFFFLIFLNFFFFFCREIADAITDKWTALKGRNITDCVRIYLTCTRKWPFFGAALFHAKVKSGGGNSDLEGVTVWLAVNEETITLLDVSSMQSVARVPYSAIVTFGGCQDDLMVVVNNCDIQGPGTQRMLFSLAKPKVLRHSIKHQKFSRI